jgi:hypothetical protein
MERRLATFRTFHHGRMSGLEVTCLKSFLDYGHDLTVFTYDPATVAPLFRTADAASIVHPEQIFFYTTNPGKGSISGFSNLFRYKLLHEFGDFWIDTDVLCLTGSWPKEYDFVAGWESDKWVGTAVLQLPTWFALESLTRCEELGDKVKWGQTGPRLVTEIVTREQLQDRLFRKEQFYPVWHQNWLEFFDEESANATFEKCSPSYAVHLWSQMIAQSGFDKSLPPPRGSHIGAAVRKHGTQEYFAPSVGESCRERIRQLKLQHEQQSKLG